MAGKERDIRLLAQCVDRPQVAWRAGHPYHSDEYYVVWKDKKEFAKDLKAIYTAPTKNAALAALDDFEQKWKSKYAYAIKLWRDNWDELTVFFDFPIEMRSIHECN